MLQRNWFVFALAGAVMAGLLGLAWWTQRPSSAARLAKHLPESVSAVLHVDVAGLHRLGVLPKLDGEEADRRARCRRRAGTGAHLSCRLEHQGQAGDYACGLTRQGAGRVPDPNRQETLDVSFPGVNVERRSNDRLPFRTAAVLVLPDGTSLRTRTVDIGKGGASVVSDMALPLNLKVTVRMTLPARPSGSMPFEAAASTVTCSLAGSLGGFRVGLQFGTLSASATAALRGVLP